MQPISIRISMVFLVDYHFWNMYKRLVLSTNPLISISLLTIGSFIKFKSINISIDFCRQPSTQRVSRVIFMDTYRFLIGLTFVNELCAFVFLHGNKWIESSVTFFLLTLQFVWSTSASSMESLRVKFMVYFARVSTSSMWNSNQRYADALWKSWYDT